MRRKRLPAPTGPLHQQILTDLRERIRLGAWVPGERLPTVRELCTTHHASLLTVHRALRALTDLGFVTTHGRLGTIVAEHPPHHCRFGLVLPELPDANGHYTHLRWEALARAAQSFTEPQRTVEIFHGVGPHPELTEHHRLRTAIIDRRLAGLIIPLATPINSWFDHPTCGLPVIGDVKQPTKRVPHLGMMDLAQIDFLDAALDYACRRKLTRIAALLHSGAVDYHGVSHLGAAASARGLDLPAHRVLGVEPRHAMWTTNAVQALVFGNPRPDVLIIGDDHLVEAATTALAGLRGPLPLVIAQANLPVEPRSLVPCVRLGWDHRDYLIIALDHLSHHLITGEQIGDHHLPLHISGDHA